VRRCDAPGAARRFRTVPPSSSDGVALIEMLSILEGFERRPLGAGSSASIHCVTESMKLACADRGHTVKVAERNWSACS
jgi:gamma-glutamyltranspeptidase